MTELLKSIFSGIHYEDFRGLLFVSLLIFGLWATVRLIALYNRGCEMRQKK